MAAKPGPYPNADRANLFGTLFITFYERWNAGGGVDECKPAFRGLMRIANSKADAKFQQNYHLLVSVQEGHKADCTDAKIGTDCAKKELTIDDMDAIVGECWNLMDRIGTYDYTGAEFTDGVDADGREEDVVSEATSKKAH